ncbi:BCS1 N terminal-domain-containing protein [Entophlyctis helioformis]|nr:BCS1 N terminal-domain-containing protein [Entophlyctis helioformis]
MTATPHNSTTTTIRSNTTAAKTNSTTTAQHAIATHAALPFASSSQLAGWTLLSAAIAMAGWSITGAVAALAALARSDTLATLSALVVNMTLPAAHHSTHASQESLFNGSLNASSPWSSASSHSAPHGSHGSHGSAASQPHGAFLSSAFGGLGLGSLDLASGSLAVMLMGSLVAGLKYAQSYIWGLSESLFVMTAELDSNDAAYLWVLTYVSEHELSKRARTFTVSTSFQHMVGQNDPYSDGEYDDDDDAYGSNRRKPIHYLPAPGRYYFLFRGRLFWLTRVRQEASRNGSRFEPSKESIKLQTYGYSRSVIEDLFQDMQQRYLAKDAAKTIVYGLGTYNNWVRLCAKPIRRLNTIVLANGLADDLLADAREFLASEDWYAQRGIPYRRGYLFHGPPGTGKSSFVAALAGALELDVYVLSLTGFGINDSALVDIFAGIPKRCIVLMEDVDALFAKRKLTHSKGLGKGNGGCGNDGNAAGGDPSGDKDGNGDDNKDDEGAANGISLSGLLNALDGLSASVGRVLIMTTNQIEKLDDALIRPGRIDMRVCFDFAARSQHRQGDPAAQLAALAEEFAAKVPERTMSTAQLNGFLMRFKKDPAAAVDAADAWLASLADPDTRPQHEHE